MKLFKPALTISILFLVISCSNKEQSNEIVKPSNENAEQTLSGVFDIPELYVTPSPHDTCSYSFPATEKVIDYDVSPLGNTVALITRENERYALKLWEFTKLEISDICELHQGFEPKAIVWHPQANAIFIMGSGNSEYQILRLEKNGDNWSTKKIFSTSNVLRRLVACPRPFITEYNNQTRKETYTYRIFFGMENGVNSFRVVSITEKGDRLYQVVGPSNTFSQAAEFDAGLNPSEIESNWALPLGFHPAGHELIWQDKQNKFHVAKYSSKAWGESKPLNINITSGTITPTPNGLGFIHWQKEKNGIGTYIIQNKKEIIQLNNYKFIATPSSVPDGKGIVGLIRRDNNDVLSYIPIEIPLADVANAWMFVNSQEELNLFSKNSGLFRPNQGDQLYQIYETENYYCNAYDRTSPTRPYIVTTDIFWELFGAAYQGLFIIKERDEAIPNFWTFVEKASYYYENSPKESKWEQIFIALRALQSNERKHNEVAKMLKAADDVSDLTHENFAFSNLKPRGHYTSSPEMQMYFRAFMYFTSIYKNNNALIEELMQLPPDIAVYAEN
ncbi:MAG TPA: hypothetical protein DCQ31_07475 [Bacteroidales bacterium]|nr:hypothetical protein [Bacteroidales bacterium]